MNLDLRSVPFSRFQSYLALRLMSGQKYVGKKNMQCN